MPSTVLSIEDESSEDLVPSHRVVYTKMVIDLLQWSCVLTPSKVGKWKLKQHHSFPFIPLREAPQRKVT